MSNQSEQHQQESDGQQYILKIKYERRSFYEFR